MDAIALDGTISLIGLTSGLRGNINTAKIITKQIKPQGINVWSKEMFDVMNKAVGINNIHNEWKLRCKIVFNQTGAFLFDPPLNSFNGIVGV